jgi:hypothetical protein
MSKGSARRPFPVLVLRGGVLEAPSRTGPVTPVPLPAAPGRVLACLATGVEEAQALAEAWGSLAGTLPPPALAVQGIDHALLDLAQLLGAEANAWSAGRARLEAALVALRREAEETRIALAVAQRALSARPPQPLRLALGTEPAAEGVCAREKVLSQPLGLAVEGIAGVEVFVSMAGDGLRARLRGAESGRILGAWEVPQAPKGWLALDLPEAVGPLREGALLEISGGPTLALEAGEVEPEGELAGRPGRALALRVWTAQPGGHFALPLHYDWEAAGLAPPAPGVRLPVAPAAWAAARADGGRVELVGAGTEAARVTVLLPGSSRTTIRLPPLATGAADLVRLEVARSLGRRQLRDLRALAAARRRAGAAGGRCGLRLFRLALPGRRRGRRRYAAASARGTPHGGGVHGDGGECGGRGRSRSPSWPGRRGRRAAHRGCRRCRLRWLRRPRRFAPRWPLPFRGGSRPTAGTTRVLLPELGRARAGWGRCELRRPQGAPAPGQPRGNLPPPRRHADRPRLRRRAVAGATHEAV